MPNTESAKKRVRQTEHRNAVNNWRKRRIKDQTKTFLDALNAGDVALAEAEFRKVAAVLDKIACTTTMHKNAAGRRKSRLAKRLNYVKVHGSLHGHGSHAASSSDKHAKDKAAKIKSAAQTGAATGTAKAGAAKPASAKAGSVKAGAAKTGAAKTGAAKSSTSKPSGKAKS